MARRAPELPPTPFRIDRRSRQPIPLQVYQGLRAAILSGWLAPGSRLPSTRALASTLGVARNRVVQAFEQLLVEGYVCSAVGAGTRVSTVLPSAARPASPGVRPRLAAAARRAARLPEQISPWRGTLRPFKVGTPAIDAAPLALWGRLLRSTCLGARREALDYGDAMGEPSLRRALAGRLYRTRGVGCDWRQVAIVAGSQQALALVGQLMLDPGDAVWVEDPGYPGARDAWSTAGARIVPVPVDASGLVVDAGKRRAPRARLVHVTPSHQFPTGVTMTLERRLALLAWSQRSGALVLEDDYDSEFRYDGRPLTALYGLGERTRVAYVGTFSKSLFPGLRLAYLVLPDRLVEPFRALRRLADGFPPPLVQQAASRLLDEGHFDRHLRRVLALYRERRDALLEHGHRHLGGLAELGDIATGLHTIAWLPPGTSDLAVAAAAANAGLDVIAVSRLATPSTARRPGLVLGFAAFEPRTIERALARLAAVLASTAP